MNFDVMISFISLLMYEMGPFIVAKKAFCNRTAARCLPRIGGLFGLIFSCLFVKKCLENEFSFL